MQYPHRYLGKCFVNIVSFLYSCTNILFLFLYSCTYRVCEVWPVMAIFLVKLMYTLSPLILKTSKTPMPFLEFFRASENSHLIPA